MAGAWRLLIHGAADGPQNMAVDEAIVERYLSSEAPAAPTLRLYGWTPPALSLGRGQPAPSEEARAYLWRHGIDLVRRPTGGRAVLHEHERTYAVIGFLTEAPFHGGVVDTYRRIADALVLALRSLGLAVAAAGGSAPTPGRPGGSEPSCFAEPSLHELQVDGRKLVGSAQLRRGRVFLQHGSLLLRADAERIGRATGGRQEASRVVGLEQALGRPVEPDELDGAIVAAFRRTFAIELRPGALTDGEAVRAAQIRCWRYDSAAWTLEGRTGRRERRWGPALEPSAAQHDDPRGAAVEP